MSVAISERVSHPSTLDPKVVRVFAAVLLLCLLPSFCFVSTFLFPNAFNSSLAPSAANILPSNTPHLTQRFSCANQSFHFSASHRQTAQSLHRTPSASHLLGILVPFRKRWTEFLYLHSKLSVFLRQQNVHSFRFFVINQTDSFRFNRGALFNIGFLAAKSYGCDYIALQDVDLIPLHHNISYRFPLPGVYHASPPDIHPIYSYSKFYGGVHLMQIQSYEFFGGFENSYFGWGREDDWFYRRIVRLELMYDNFSMTRPVVANESERTGVEFWEHNHGKHAERDREGLFSKRNRRTGKGVKHLEFECKEVYSSEEQMVDIDTIVMDVELQCDTGEVPQCVSNWTLKEENRDNRLRREQALAMSALSKERSEALKKKYGAKHNPQKKTENTRDTKRTASADK
eukprot:CAMPEP_0182452348 /NCGR_PEP_ID=MMETSP1172-20130603/44202_1 /TAXON_ID=708627 /ORGANISM="Timspurckia oligopyrenoides, Strain CCMP3278" /LENGTH=399 /DNA_ID=CAMNT_0024650177 /DNA_START=1975 /DNA_END=3174 /DNA_ORIENTATION=+